MRSAEINRRFLDEVLGPNDDITLFEYVKRNNRETGPALVGIEIGDRADRKVAYEDLTGFESPGAVFLTKENIGA